MWYLRNLTREEHQKNFPLELKTELRSEERINKLGGEAKEQLPGHVEKTAKDPHDRRECFCLKKEKKDLEQKKAKV